MGSEVRSIFKTCSTCKATFSSLRELITHENDHLPKLPIDHFAAPVWPPIGSRPPIRSSAGSSILDIRDKIPINPADTGSVITQNGGDRDSEMGIKWTGKGDISKGYRQIPIAEIGHGRTRYYCSNCPVPGRRQHFLRKEDFEKHISTVHGLKSTANQADSDSDVGNSDPVFIFSRNISGDQSISGSGSGSGSSDQSISGGISGNISTDQSISAVISKISTPSSTFGLESTGKRRRAFCRYCFKDITARYKYDHEKTLHKDGRYYCSVCRDTERVVFRPVFANQEELRQHLMQKHGYNSEFIDCAFIPNGKKKRRSWMTDQASTSSATDQDIDQSYIDKIMMNWRSREIDSDQEGCSGYQDRSLINTEGTDFNDRSLNNSDFGDRSLGNDDQSMGAGISGPDSFPSAWRMEIKEEVDDNGDYQGNCPEDSDGESIDNPVGDQVSSAATSSAWMMVPKEETENN